MTLADTDLLTDAVIDLLRTELTPWLVGDGQMPTPPAGADTLDLVAGPFVVVRQLGIGATFPFGGYAGQPESHEVVRYEIVAGGAQRSQADLASRKAIKVLCDRVEAGPNPRAYVHALVVAGHDVIERRYAGAVPVDALGTVQTGGLVDITIGLS